MSSDLEFREDPPRDDTLTLPPIKTRRCPLSPRSDDYRKSEDGSDDKKDIIPTAEGAVIPDGEDAGCRTPTSSEHKIPQPLKCPPAPRKPPRRACSGKRKASELRMQFFEEANRDEVEDLFIISSFEDRLNNSSARQVLKRRRSSCEGFVARFR